MRGRLTLLESLKGVFFYCFHLFEIVVKIYIIILRKAGQRGGELGALLSTARLLDGEIKMKELLSLQFTIFVLIAVGVLVKKKKIIGTAGQKNITDLVIYVVLPCNTVCLF